MGMWLHDRYGVCVCLHFRNLFSDYTNITVQLRQNHATLQFTLMFKMLPHSLPFLIRHYI